MVFHQRDFKKNQPTMLPVWIP